MDLFTQLHELLSRKDIAPLSQNEILKALKLSGNQKSKLVEILNVALHEGKIAKVKGDKFCLPKDADLVSGKIVFRASGAAILLADDRKPGDPLAIPRENTFTAFHGDRVLVRLVRARPRPVFRRGKKLSTPKDDGKPVGQVIQILDRARTTVIGSLQKNARFFFVAPDDPRVPLDILVPHPNEAQTETVPQIDDKVLVELDDWTNPHQNPTGAIIEVIGKTHEPKAEFRAILLKFNLDPDFPDHVEAEVAEMPDDVRPQDRKERVDLTKIDTLTIDPIDAKDFDDALSVERLEDDKLRIGIHIADVSGYVKTGTALDKEARRRGNSTYLVGKVIPMLPEKLSNGLCSLVEGQVRLTKSVFLEFDKKGEIVGTEFANSFIRSRKRLSYPQAYALLKEDDLAIARAVPQPAAHQTGAQGRPLTDLSDEELRKIQQQIRDLWSIAKQMREQRMKKGSLDLDMPEVKIFTDANGYADRIVQIEHDESHQLVEEFMLGANEAVAKEMARLRLPAIYRVHEKPDEEKLADLSDFLTTFQISSGDLTNRKHVVKLLKEFKTHPQGHTLKIQFLRSLKQARYQEEPIGHYGLHKKDYLHFTSPIRRYSDLVVHRIMDKLAEHHQAAKGGKRTGVVKSPYTQAQLAELGAHVSLTEQNSTEAERESNKVKLLEFYEREVDKNPPTVFSAMVLDLKNHGVFVEMKDSQAFGFIAASSLRDDLYQLNQAGTEMRGRKTGKTILLGEEVKVTVARVDRFKRQMDFNLVWTDDAEGGRKQHPPRPAFHPKPKASAKTAKAEKSKESEKPGKTGKSRRRRR